MMRAGSVPFCSSLEDEHLVGVRAVDAGLTGRHALAGHDHRLHAHQELVVAIDAGGRGDDDPAGGAVDGNHGPGGAGRGRQRGQDDEGEDDDSHGAP